MKIISKIFYIVLVLFVALFSAAFAVQNSHTVDLYYYIGQTNLPLSVLLVFCFALGVLFCLILGGFIIVKLKISLSNCSRKYNTIEKKLQAKLSEDNQKKHTDKSDLLPQIK